MEPIKQIQADRDWDAKQLMMRMSREHPLRDHRWQDLLSWRPELQDVFLTEAKKAADWVGYQQGEWKDIPRESQLELGRFLLSYDYFEQGVHALNHSIGASHSGNTAVDRYLDLTHLQQLHKRHGDYYLARIPLINTVSAEMWEEKKLNKYVEHLFPKNENPQELNSVHLEQMLLDPYLKRDDVKQMLDYGETRGIRPVMSQEFISELLEKSPEPLMPHGPHYTIEDVRVHRGLVEHIPTPGFKR